jgi:hypothetical protein
MPYLVFKSPHKSNIVERVKGFALIHLIGSDSLDFHVVYKNGDTLNKNILILGIALCNLTKSEVITIVNFPNEFESDDELIKTFKHTYLGIVEDDYDKLSCKKYAQFVLKISSIEFYTGYMESEILDRCKFYLESRVFTIEELDELKNVTLHSIKQIDDCLNDKKKDAENSLLNYIMPKLIKRKF